MSSRKPPMCVHFLDILLSQTPCSNPKFNPTIPSVPTTCVTHVEDDDEDVFYDCVD
jgi:hypothetical protein